MRGASAHEPPDRPPTCRREPVPRVSGPARGTGDEERRGLVVRAWRPYGQTLAGQSVIATLKRYAALVPMDTRRVHARGAARELAEERGGEAPAHPELDGRGQDEQQPGVPEPAAAPRGRPRAIGAHQHGHGQRRAHDEAQAERAVLGAPLRPLPIGRLGPAPGVLGHEVAGAGHRGAELGQRRPLADPRRRWRARWRGSRAPTGPRARRRAAAPPSGRTRPVACPRRADRWSSRRRPSSPRRRSSPRPRHSRSCRSSRPRRPSTQPPKRENTSSSYVVTFFCLSRGLPERIASDTHEAMCRPRRSFCTCSTAPSTAASWSRTVHAVLVLLHHPLDALHLALDAPEAPESLRPCVLVDHRVPPVNGARARSIRATWYPASATKMCLIV